MTATVEEIASVFEAKRTSLVRMAAHVMRDRDNAEDVVQRAFFKAFRHSDQYEARNGSSLSTWIHRIVLMEALNELRVRRSRPAVVEFDDAPPVRAKSNPELELLEASLNTWLATAISRLPRLQRRGILTQLAGMSLNETADHFRATLPAVKSWRNRGVEALRQQAVQDGLCRP